MRNVYNDYATADEASEAVERLTEQGFMAWTEARDDGRIVVLTDVPV